MNKDNINPAGDLNSPIAADTAHAQSCGQVSPVSGGISESGSDESNYVKLSLLIQTLYSLFKTIHQVLFSAAAAFIVLTVLMYVAETNRLKFFGIAVNSEVVHTPWEIVYLCFTTTLTIGSGTIAPETWLGQVVAILLGCLGVCLIGIVVWLVTISIPDSEKKLNEPKNNRG